MVDDKSLLDESRTDETRRKRQSFSHSVQTSPTCANLLDINESSDMLRSQAASNALKEGSTDGPSIQGRLGEFRVQLE